MNTPLSGLTKTIVQQRQQGISVVDLSQKYKVSRQAIYDLLKKAEKEGSSIPWHTPVKAKSYCAICGKEYFGKSKTCGIECRKKLLAITLSKKDAKWSRYILLDLKCDCCGKDFKRTKYQQSISVSKKCYKKEIKQNYCSAECYYNRTGVRDIN